MAAGGQFAGRQWAVPWPPMGSFSWPLTAEDERLTHIRRSLIQEALPHFENSVTQVLPPRVLASPSPEDRASVEANTYVPPSAPETPPAPALRPAALNLR
jgi:hypothetical protein